LIYSPTSQHALRAMIYIARHSDGSPIRTAEIAEAEVIPKQFLSKILHGLRNKGLVKSVKGPGGGFVLALPAEEVTMNQIIRAVVGDVGPEEKCILGHDNREGHLCCALSQPWQELCRQFESTIGRLTLKEAADNARKAEEAGRDNPVEKVA